MSFKPGDKKPEKSGRQKGTPNKKTELLLEIFEDAKYCPAERAVALLNSGTLDPEVEFSGHMKMMEFKFPKRKAVEHSGPNDGPIETETYEQYVQRVKDQAANGTV